MPYYGVERAILEHFYVDPDDHASWTSSTEIVMAIRDSCYGSGHGLAMIIARYMKDLGVSKRKCTTDGVYRWGYVGVRRKQK